VSTARNLKFYESSESLDHLNTLNFSRKDVRGCAFQRHTRHAAERVPSCGAGCVGCATDVPALEPRGYTQGPRGDLALHGDTEDVQTCILDIRLHRTG
jgi:hypothetical protein